MSVTYFNVNGQIAAQKAGSTYTEFIPDPLGNVIACRNSSGTITHTAEYWPYGETRTTTGFNPSPWAFCGTWGYRQDPGGQMYVRARYYRPTLGRWQTVDPLWPWESGFGYVNLLPITLIDPSGLKCTASDPPCNITVGEICGQINAILEGMLLMRIDNNRKQKQCRLHFSGDVFFEITSGCFETDVPNLQPRCRIPKIKGKCAAVDASNEKSCKKVCGSGRCESDSPIPYLARWPLKPSFRAPVLKIFYIELSDLKGSVRFDGKMVIGTCK